MVRWIKQTAILIWKLWVALVLAIGSLVCVICIFLFLPFNHYPLIYVFIRLWAISITILCGFYVVKSIESKLPKQAIFIANHRSIIDVLLFVYILRRPMVFIGKKELERLPLFGPIYKKLAITVDRKNKADRNLAFQRAVEAISGGANLALFPEGGIPKYKTELADFRTGAFRMAVQTATPIVPVTILPTDKRLPYALFKGSPGRIRIHIHSSVEPNSEAYKDEFELMNYCRTIIDKRIQSYKNENR